MAMPKGAPLRCTRAQAITAPISRYSPLRAANSRRASGVTRRPPRAALLSCPPKSMPKPSKLT